MPEQDFPNEERQADRIEEVVRDLLAGRPWRPRKGDDREAILAAARLAGAREGYARMAPDFLGRLERALAPGAQSRVTRRNLLVTGAAGLAAVAGGLAGLGLGRLTEPTRAPMPKGAALVPEPGRWIDVAALSDLHPGAGVKVHAGAVSAYLFRDGDQVFAVSAICSHLPCGLEWMAGPGVLMCPCHQQTFSARGQSLSANYSLPDLSQIKVRVTSAGRVEVMGT